MSRFLRSSGGKASALLQKANAQLRGERVIDTKGDDDDDGLGAYLSSLGQEPTRSSQPDWGKFGELSDISISDAQDSSPRAAPVSKFVKKKPAAAAEDGIKPARKQVSQTPVQSGKGPNMSRTTNATSKGAYTSKSSALSKVAAFSAKYSSKEKKKEVLLSDSDLDMDLSMDEDILADVRAIKGQPVEKPEPKKAEHPPDASPTRKQATLRDVAQPNYSTSAARPGSSLSISDSSEIGKGGSKFLKKKPAAVNDEADSQPHNKKPASPKSPKTPRTPRESGGKKRSSMFTLKSAEKYSTQVVLDTDEESLADFIGGLNSSGSSVHVSASPSPRTPRHSLKSPVSARSPEPMELIQEVDDEISEASRSEIATESFKSMSDPSEVNVMDFEELQPVTPSVKPKSKAKNKVTVQSPPAKDSKSKIDKKNIDKKNKSTAKARRKEKKNSSRGSSSNVFQGMGVQSVDDLFKAAETDDASDESIQEIPDRPVTPLRSILSPTPRSAVTPRSSQSRVRLSLGSLTEIRSRSPSPDTLSEERGSVDYTSEFDPTESIKSIQTESESEADSVATQGTVSSVSTIHSSRPRSARSRTRRRSEDYYSDDFTSGASMTDASERSRRYSYSRSLSQDSATYSETHTSYSDTATDRSRTPSPSRRLTRSHSEDKPKKVKMRSQEIQTGLDTGSLYYHWNVDAGSIAMMAPPLGLGRVDPTPIASHVVSPDAIEAMTAYSPSVLALNDMLRQQLELTTSFLRTQRRMHQAYVGTTIPDHKYTTLSDTKEYIKRHKREKLTFEEALRQVKLEMGLET